MSVREVSLLLLLLGVVGFVFHAESSAEGTSPTAEDMRLAKDILRQDATLSMLSGLGSALGGPTIAIDFETLEPYVRPRLMEAVRQGALSGGGYLHNSDDVYDELVAMPCTTVALPYYRLAAESMDPLFRSVGLAKLVRTDGQRAEDHLRHALGDPHVVVRCEGIAALIFLKGTPAALHLKPLSKWQTLLERCEAAAALVRLGDLTAAPLLDESISALRSTQRSWGFYDWDYVEWTHHRLAYYTVVLESTPIGQETVRAGQDSGDDFATSLEALASLFPLVGEPSAYLRPLLASCLRHPHPHLRAQAVRCLGRIADEWATELLRTRVADEALCTLNDSGYGWHATLGCLAAICLLERGDRSGIEVLRDWVASHRLFIKTERVYRATYSQRELPVCTYASQWDSAPAVALARAGEEDVADVLRFGIERWLSRDPEHWEGGSAWAGYHLARLGDSLGLDALRRQLTFDTGNAYHNAEWRREAAAAIVALHHESGRPLLYAPARGIGGPVSYPDCLTP